MFSLDLDAKALTKSYRCQPTSSLTACANWIYDVSASPPPGTELHCRNPQKNATRVLSCLIHASCWANAPRWGGRLRCWLAAPLPLPQTWTCCAVQIVTRVPLSLYLGPRLVNVVSLAYKILTANHVLIMQPKGRTTDECSIRVPQMSGRQF